LYLEGLYNTLAVMHYSKHRLITLEA